MRHIVFGEDYVGIGVCSLIRLLVREQSDLGLYCLQNKLPNYISSQESSQEKS